LTDAEAAAVFFDAAAGCRRPSWSAGNAAQGDLTAGKAAALPSIRISR